MLCDYCKMVMETGLTPCQQYVCVDDSSRALKKNESVPGCIVSLH